MKHAMTAALLSLAIVELSAREPFQAATVRVDVPATVSFQVNNATPGNVTVSGPFRVSFNQAALLPGRALRVSVKADGTLTLPGGLAVPISNIKWTVTGTSNGTGTNGTLSASTYTSVFLSRTNPSSGRVDLSWSFTVPAGVTRSGTAQVNLRWLFESV